MVDVEDIDVFNQLWDPNEHQIFRILRKSFDTLLPKINYYLWMQFYFAVKMILWFTNQEEITALNDWV